MCQNEGSGGLPLKQGRVGVDGLTGILEGSTGRAKSRQWLLNVGTGVSAALWGQVPLLLEDANGISCLHGRLGGARRVGATYLRSLGT